MYVNKSITIAGLVIFFLILLSNSLLCIEREDKLHSLSGGNNNALNGFAKSSYLDEQILSFKYSPDISVEINAPSQAEMDRSKKLMIIFYALPNMNTIDETIGRQKSEGLDWHYDIQHIGAQTRYLRTVIKNYNIVIAYVGTKEESWPWWRLKYPGGDYVIRNLIDSVKNIFKGYKKEIALDGHSGGGSFVFGFINNCINIPDYVNRISFLDSEYDYSDSLKHGDKIIKWLYANPDHRLCIIAYDDRDVIIDGKNIGTYNGGTYLRTNNMTDRLSKAFNLSRTEDTVFTEYTELKGRIKIFIKSNPDHQMWHTLLVEKNGFIESILSGTSYDELGYQFWGPRIYSQYIQP
jgi:hypothetical protein